MPSFVLLDAHRMPDPVFGTVSSVTEDVTEDIYTTRDTEQGKTHFCLKLPCGVNDKYESLS